LFILLQVKVYKSFYAENCIRPNLDIHEPVQVQRLDFLLEKHLCPAHQTGWFWESNLVSKTKISALTSAITTLAETEVLPIVHATPSLTFTATYQI